MYYISNIFPREFEMATTQLTSHTYCDFSLHIYIIHIDHPVHPCWWYVLWRAGWRFFLAGSSKVVAVSHNLKIWSLYLSPSSGLNECLWQWVHSFGCHHWYQPRWYVGPNLESWLYDLGVHYGLVLHHCKTKTHMYIFLLGKNLVKWKIHNIRIRNLKTGLSII